jgi:hypothetical protein
VCGHQLVQDELVFKADDIICSVCDPQTPHGVNTPLLSHYWDIGAAVATCFSPLKPCQGARNLETAVVSGDASMLQQIGAVVVRHLSPSKPHKSCAFIPS